MLTLSPQAQSDLDAIWLYIAQDDPLAADGVIDYIRERANLLVGHPTVGRMRDDLSFDCRCHVVFKAGWRSRFMIFYRVRDEKIEIARILEGHQNIDEGFFDE